LSREGAPVEETWQAPKIDEREIELLCSTEMLPSAMVFKAVRGTGTSTMGEEHTVVLVDQFKCGLSFPLSSFSR
jgi:hypothetical protein